MKKIIFFTLVLCMVASTAMAKDMKGRIGLGFTSSDTPVGIRYWAGEKVGIDLGVGFTSTSTPISTGTGTEKQSATSFAFSVGVPVGIITVMDRANFNFLPVFLYESIGKIDADNEESDTFWALGGFLEFEVFVFDAFSVSASHGIAYEYFKPGKDKTAGAPDTESTTAFSTVGANVTEFGFHFYFAGGS